jgi:hypothetical protein
LQAVCYAFEGSHIAKIPSQILLAAIKLHDAITDHHHIIAAEPPTIMKYATDDRSRSCIPAKSLKLALTM